MRYLLDTNALIWTVFNPDRLSERAREEIETCESLCTSIVSLWEIGIKQAIGKLDIDSTVSEIEASCNSLGIEVIPLTAEHIDTMKILPMRHKDPFDRIIIAQAITNGVSLISSDQHVMEYREVETLW